MTPRIRPVPRPRVTATHCHARAPLGLTGVWGLMIHAVAPLVLALAVAAVARGEAPIPNAPMVVLRLEGVIEPTREAAGQTGGFTIASLGFLDGKSTVQRWLRVITARTMDGDDQFGGKDVLDAVAPFQPNFLIAGPADVMAGVRDAPSGTTLTIQGLVDRDSRTYYLSRVEREHDHPAEAGGCVDADALPRPRSGGPDHSAEGAAQSGDSFRSGSVRSHTDGTVLRA